MECEDDGSRMQQESRGREGKEEGKEERRREERREKKRQEYKGFKKEKLRRWGKRGEDSRAAWRKKRQEVVTTKFKSAFRRSISTKTVHAELRDIQQVSSAEQQRCAQRQAVLMGREQEIEWARGREGREEMGEKGSGRQKDESREERRQGSGDDEEMRERESRERIGKRRAEREWQP
ncbi:octapeptide-repeat protein T2-like [Embiotoca jacksoni]|uniref:octapeptide-repeat protein T2-like n=1 Tax=Embiotoca jacksoni TaxID=100190 RepID=UPI003703EB36